MAGVIPNVAEPFLLDDSLAYRNGWKVGLFSNSFSPNKDTVIGDLVECTFPGYARQNTTAWGISGESGDKARSQETVHIFTRSSTGTAQNVAGYFLVDASGNLMVVEAAGAPVALTNAGDVFTVLPKMSLTSDPGP